MTHTKTKREIAKENHKASKERPPYIYEELSFEGVLMRATLYTDDCTMDEDYACKITTFISSLYPPEIVCEAYGESEDFIEQATYALKQCNTDPEDIEDKIGCTFLRYDDDIDYQKTGMLYKSLWNGVYYLKPMEITNEIFEELSSMHLEKKNKFYKMRDFQRLKGFDHSLEYFVKTIEDHGGCF